jgi:2-polyprenyl-6-methoxyphenol hydroxylase-like FAD-dependent oxidoreductase
VRKLVFGPHEDYLHPLGYMIGACVLSKPVEGYRSDEGLVLAEAGRSAWLFAYANHNPTVLFSYRTNDVNAEFSRPPIESLRRAFGPQPTGSVLGQLLDQYEVADEALFDSVNQVKMDRWHQGRVVLIGDAAWCPTLYSGMGASSGMAGSELLGDILETYPDNLSLALLKWEERMRPFADGLQQSALNERIIFTPHSEVQRVLRAALFSLMAQPAVRHIMGRFNNRNNLKSFDIVTQSLPART